MHTDTSVKSKLDSVTKERMSQKLIKIEHQFISDLHMTRLNYISGANMYFLIIRTLKITKYSSPSKKTCQTLNKNVTNANVHVKSLTKRFKQAHLKIRNLWANTVSRVSVN